MLLFTMILQAAAGAVLGKVGAAVGAAVGVGSVVGEGLSSPGLLQALRLKLTPPPLEFCSVHVLSLLLQTSLTSSVQVVV